MTGLSNLSHVGDEVEGLIIITTFSYFESSAETFFMYLRILYCDITLHAVKGQYARNNRVEFLYCEPHNLHLAMLFIDIDKICKA